MAYHSYPKPLSTADGTLCNSCEDLLGGPYEDYPKKEVSRSFQSVQDGRASCKFCDLIFRKVSRDSVSVFQDQPGYRFTRQLTWDRPAIRAVYGPSRSALDDRREPHFIFIPSKDVENGKFFASELDTANKSGRAQELMNTWMENCIMHHTDCRNVSDKQWRPTRLLELGQSPKFDSLRLCEGDEIARGVEYMTLSHCWGDSQPIKLTRRTRTQFRNSIAFADLPQTFRDALEVVKRFGKRYIWIDSICILQDSSEDWHKEADMMCSVYRNSFCNIGATGASDSSQGCFIEHTDEVLRVSANFEARDYISTRSLGTDFYYFDYQEWFRTLETAPLHKRAWVVQERLLAPRMLHFGLSQIAWECNELQATERFPRGFKGMHYYPDISGPPKDMNSSRSLNSTEIWIAWSKVMKAYPDTHLTVESDRIPALTGIIDRYKALTSDDFIAGLWRSTFERDLNWYAVRPGKRHDSYIAPSWSWLSVKDTHILGSSLSDSNRHVLVSRVLSADVTPSPSGSKYTVIDGCIRFCGKLASAMWSSNAPGDPKRTLLVRLGPYTTQALCCHFRADTLEAMRATEVLLFPTFAFAPLEVIFLVLERNGEDPATYRRIGRCNTEHLTNLWKACDFFTNTLHVKSEERGLKPVLCDGLWVSVYGSLGYYDYQKQDRVKAVSFTVK